MYLCTKNEICRSRHSKVTAWTVQIDRCDQMYYHTAFAWGREDLRMQLVSMMLRTMQQNPPLHRTHSAVQRSTMSNVNSMSTFSFSQLPQSWVQLTSYTTQSDWTNGDIVHLSYSEHSSKTIDQCHNEPF